MVLSPGEGSLGPWRAENPNPYAKADSDQSSGPAMRKELEGSGNGCIGILKVPTKYVRVFQKDAEL